MNKILEELLTTGTTKTPGGEIIELHGNIDHKRSKILSYLVQEIKPRTTLEVGLAYGVSALTICSSIPKGSHVRHIVIDPHQNRETVWNGIGLYNLERAGFSDIIEFYDQPSYRALPIIESKNTKIDFAFIDGWHTFDYTLVDFFYIDKILNSGGFAAFDDANWPAVRRVCRFIVKNLNYSVYELPSNLVSVPETKTDQKTASIHILDLVTNNLKQLHPAHKKHKSEDAQKIEDFKLGLKGNLIVFKKESDDSRKWNHYVDF